MFISQPPIADLVIAKPRRMRHRTTELMVHKCSPAGLTDAHEVAAFFLSTPEGVATTALAGSYESKVDVFYGWARHTPCPVCGAAPGVPCIARGRRRATPHVQRAGLIPQKHRDGADVPYHLMIDPAGEVSQHLPLMARGRHEPRSNARSIAVALLGDFDRQKPSAAAMNSLRWAAKWLCFSPEIRLETNQDQGLLAVVGHDQVRDHPKGCPGRHLMEEIAGLNRWLRGLQRENRSG